jgi:hypothetical protein
MHVQVLISVEDFGEEKKAILIRHKKTHIQEKKRALPVCKYNSMQTRDALFSPHRTVPYTLPVQTKCNQIKAYPAGYIFPLPSRLTKQSTKLCNYSYQRKIMQYY